jgi:hypothetical protein
MGTSRVGCGAQGAAGAGQPDPYGDGQQPAYGQQPGYAPQPGYGQQAAYGQPPEYAPPPGYAPTYPAAYGPIGGYQPYPQDIPPTYLGWAIAATIFGFLTCMVGLGMGIAAIVLANQVKSKAAYGDFAGAADSSRRARNLAIAATVVDAIGIVVVVIYVILAINGSNVWRTPRFPRPPHWNPVGNGNIAQMK